RIPLEQILRRDAQLVEIQRRYGADHLRVVLLGKPPRLGQTVVLLLDQQADQVTVAGQAIAVLFHLVRAGGQYLAAAAGEPDRVAAALALLEMQRSARCIRRQSQTQAGTLALHLIGGQTLLAQQHLQRPRLGSANAQAVVQTLLFEQVAAALQLGDAQRLGGTAERSEQNKRKQQGTGGHGRLRKRELGIATRPP